MKTSIVEQIKYQLSITSVLNSLGYSIGAIRNGRGKIKCPLHNDKHPSLIIYINNNSWWCPVCNVGGNQFNMWMQFRNCNFKTALHDLAELAGIKITKTISQKVVQRNEKQEKLQEFIDKFDALRQEWLRRFTPLFCKSYSMAEGIFYCNDYTHLKEWEKLQLELTEAEQKYIAWNNRQADAFEKFKMELYSKGT